MVAKKRTKRLTQKQARLVELLWDKKYVKSPLGEILLAAWYEEYTARNPWEIIAWKGIQEALRKKGLNEERLAQKQEEHLEARKIEIKNYWLYVIPESEEEIEELKEEFQEDLSKHIMGAKFLSMKQRIETKGKNETPYIEVRYSVPDYTTQRDTVKDLNKIFGNYAPEKLNVWGNLSILWLFHKTKEWNQK